MAKKISKRLKLTGESYISMALGLLVVVVIGVLIYNFFQAKRSEEKPGEEEIITGEEIESEEKAALPTIHKVAAGDTLWLIAEKYFDSGYNWVDIAKENNLQNPNYIEVNQELKIPKTEKRLPTAAISEESYTVVKGDNLWNIAVRAYGDGFAWIRIAQANNLANPNLIHAGNVFVIPR